MKNMKIKYFIIFFIIVLLVLVCYLLIPRKTEQTLENRVLVIVMEENFSQGGQSEHEYQQQKGIMNTFFSLIFRVSRKNLDDKTLSEIIDVYGEDYLANQFKKAAKGYGEIIILTDEEASYSNFKKVLLDINGQGKTMDIVLDLHGGPKAIYFYKQKVYKEDIARDRDLKGLNIGYVYQTVCFGGQNIEFWIDIGAKVVSGSKEGNAFVLLAPGKFLKFWTGGETYYDAVNGGFKYELRIQKAINRFSPVEMFPLDERTLKGSEMVFVGDKDYGLK